MIWVAAETETVEVSQAQAELLRLRDGAYETDTEADVKADEKCDHRNWTRQGGKGGKETAPNTKA